MEFAPMQPRSIDKIARSAVFAVVARGAMVLMTCIVIPIAGYLFQRGVSSVDHLVETNEQTRLTLVLIQQRLQDMRDTQKDHETRLRIIESVKR